MKGAMPLLGAGELYFMGSKVLLPTQWPPHSPGRGGGAPVNALQSIFYFHRRFRTPSLETVLGMEAEMNSRPHPE